MVEPMLTPLPAICGIGRALRPAGFWRLGLTRRSSLGVSALRYLAPDRVGRGTPRASACRSCRHHLLVANRKELLYALRGILVSEELLRVYGEHHAGAFASQPKRPLDGGSPHSHPGGRRPVP